MAKKRTPHSSRSITEAIQRRDALKKLGALAICAPTLASIACDDDPEAGDAGMFQSGAEPGTGGNPAGMLDAGGGTTSGATAGGGTAGGGTAGGSTTGGGGTSGGVAAGGTPGGTTGGGAADAGMGTIADATAGDAGASAAGFFPPMFQDAGTCSLTPPDMATEGPFFIHEDEVMTDPTLVRSDLRDGRPGVELQLNLRLLNAGANCMMQPIQDVEVYIWHTDAVGLYSGFNGQNPNAQYMGCIERTIENGERFCRGMQVTDAQGVVSFRTLYPGWYFGRPIHIHFVALRKGSSPSHSGNDPSYRSPKYHMFTTQMYFEETFSKNIHENNAPYTTRVNTNGYATYIKPGRSTVRPSTRMEGNVAVASLNIITNISESRGVGGGFDFCPT